MGTSRGHKLPYLLRVAAALSRSPEEAVERIHERIAERRERRAGPPVYEAEQEWEAKLHAVLGRRMALCRASRVRSTLERHTPVAHRPESHSGPRRLRRVGRRRPRVCPRGLVSGASSASQEG